MYNLGYKNILNCLKNKLVIFNSASQASSLLNFGLIVNNIKLICKKKLIKCNRQIVYNRTGKIAHFNVLPTAFRYLLMRLSTEISTNKYKKPHKTKSWYIFEYSPFGLQYQEEKPPKRIKYLMFCGLMGLTCQSQNRPAATGPEVSNTRYFYIESKVLALTCAVFINNVKRIPFQPNK